MNIHSSVYIPPDPLALPFVSEPTLVTICICVAIKNEGSTVGGNVYVEFRGTL